MMHSNRFLTPVPGLLGCLQALEVIKILAELDSVFTSRILIVDAFDLQFRHIRVQRNKECQLCGTLNFSVSTCIDEPGESPRITALADYTSFCGTSPTDKVLSEILFFAQALLV